MSYSNGPRIITNGLLLHLDAANPRSYVSGSNSWNDLSNNGNNFTLYNGITYLNNSLYLDGTNQYIRSTSTLDLSPYNYITVEMTVNATNNSAPRNMFEQTANWNTNTGGFGFFLFSDGNAASTTTHHRNHNPPGLGGGGRNYIFNSYNVWSVHTNVYSKIVDTTGRLAYCNGNLTPFSTDGGYPTTTDSDNSSFANDYFYIGMRGGTQFPFLGYISSIKIYGKKLASSEIKQNYNATKGRYNL